ncbi:YtxH domain-containing protein [Patescibacteria group bacterium]|nr:YtxH domain-containing protein [Patescibacteria group bacterium]
MNSNNNQHHSNGFANGFLFGLIIGAAVVFLLATKKGRKILKLISEEGLDNLTNIVEEYTSEAEEENAEEDVQEQEIDDDSTDGPEEVKPIKKSKKRFFRRSK